MYLAALPPGPAWGTDLLGGDMLRTGHVLRVGGFKWRFVIALVVALAAPAGTENGALGYEALRANKNGDFNDAIGAYALTHTTSSSNLAAGVQALYHDTTGATNTAAGTNALHENTTGTSNIALGNRAGYNLTTGSNNIDIANQGVAADTGNIRIGTQGTQKKAFMAGIYGVVPSGTTKAVVINASGQLGTATTAPARAGSSAQAATIQHQQQEIDQLKKEVAQLKTLVTR